MHGGAEEGEGALPRRKLSWRHPPPWLWFDGCRLWGGSALQAWQSGGREGRTPAYGFLPCGKTAPCH